MNNLRLLVDYKYCLTYKDYKEVVFQHNKHIFYTLVFPIEKIQLKSDWIHLIFSIKVPKELTVTMMTLKISPNMVNWWARCYLVACIWSHKSRTKPQRIIFTSSARCANTINGKSSNNCPLQYCFSNHLISSTQAIYEYLKFLSISIISLSLPHRSRYYIYILSSYFLFTKWNIFRNGNHEYMVYDIEK